MNSNESHISFRYVSSQEKSNHFVSDLKNSISADCQNGYAAVVDGSREKSELTSLAKERGYSVDQLAEKLGVERITVWRHGRGERSPSIDERRQYAEALRCTLEDIDGIVARARARFIEQSNERGATHKRAAHRSHRTESTQRKDD